MAQSPEQNNNTATKSPPKRWTIGGVLMAIFLAVYAAARPTINERFNLNLPPLVQSDDASSPPATSPGKVALEKPKAEPKKASKPPLTEQFEPAAEQPKLEQPEQTKAASKTSSSNTKAGTKSTSTKPPATKPPLQVPSKSSEPAPNPSKSSQPKANTTASKTPTDSSELRFGILKSLPRDEYISPAGLRYTPGSEEGHRLKHLERHTADQPNRPGRHGVFLGGMEGALKAIDEAYTKAKSGDRNVQTQEEDGRTIYTVDLRRRIGFIGGIEGNRRNKPHAYRVRLVLDDDRVITAYPM